MKKTIKAVIGAGYGDEGKGLTVSRLVAGPETLVARFNSGGQAGHTVETDDGRRHIFHHVGSGAFQEAPTFLSRFFVSNPMVLADELEQLRRVGVRAPLIFADRRGLLTTPYDMLINQIVEMARGGRRHGSCGIGFGETIERAGQGFGLTLADLERPDLRRQLEIIRDVWTPQRLAALGVTQVPDEYRELLASEDLLDSFLNVAELFSSEVAIGSDEPLRVARDVVFEGAQGLLLDQDRGAFPFVTRSNTGLKNILALCRDTGLGEVEAFYATRCYVTRHGAGPLPGELPAAPFEGIVDETNILNAWQGALRFAHLDVDRLIETVRADLSDAQGSGMKVKPGFAVNCLDQAPSVLPVVCHGAAKGMDPSDLLASVSARAGFAVGMEGWGPRWSDFGRIEKIGRAA